LIFSPDSLIYVTNFEHDVFYKTYDDTNIYTDAKLSLLGVNPSYVLTKLDRRKKLNYLSYLNISLASRVKLHLDEKIYESQFIDEMNWDIVSKSINDTGSYTSEAKALLSSKIKDDIFSLPDNEYKDFDHSYKTITAEIKKPDEYSITSLNSYYTCPFLYYLQNILKLDNNDPDDDTYARDFGNFCHHIFENIYAADFDFEKVFQEARNEFIESRKKNNIPTTNRELMFSRYLS
jgi:ATP-dependent helicase/DNAse subunit B